MIPTARVWHVLPGQSFKLKRDPRTHTIEVIKGRHAHCTDGLIVSLCHPVDERFMKFGDGAGWRPV